MCHQKLGLYIHIEEWKLYGVQFHGHSRIQPYRITSREARALHQGGLLFMSMTWYCSYVCYWYLFMHMSLTVYMHVIDTVHGMAFGHGSIWIVIWGHWHGTRLRMAHRIHALPAILLTVHIRPSNRCVSRGMLRCRSRLCARTRLKHVTMHQFAIPVLSFGVRACVGLPLLLRHFVGRFAVPIGFSVYRRPKTTCIR
jgi:hypothetical protein